MAASLNRKFSIWLVDANESFWEWDRRRAERTGQQIFRNDAICEHSCYIVPPMGVGTGTHFLFHFIDEIKPNLLLRELAEYGITPQEFGHPITKETFDEFFTLQSRAFVEALPEEWL
jgi:hypothetical protein